MTLTIAVLGIKGGVGKTTTAVNLAGLAAISGLRTLVWDLDPQGAASFALGFDKTSKGAARRITRKRPDLDDAVVKTTMAGLDLIPADVSLRTLDFELAQRSQPKRRISHALTSVDDRYDVVFIDCPPGVTLANDSAMRAAQVYLSPIVPTSLATRAFEQLVTYVDENPKANGQLFGVLSMVDRRKREHRDLAERLPLEHPQVLKSSIPSAVAVETSPLHHAPFVFTGRSSRAAIAYRDLWNEVQSRVHGQRISASRPDG